MRQPDVYTPTSLTKLVAETQQERNGRWLPVRPEGLWGYSWRRRLQAAWRVFIGRYDVIDWDRYETDHFVGPTPEPHP